MNPEQQLQTVREVLLAIAPSITTRALDRLALTIGNPYSDQPAEGFEEARRKIFDEHTTYAIELASRLAGRFAQLHDDVISIEAQNAPQTQSASKTGQQSAPKSIAQILSQPSGISSEALKLQAMRERRDRGAP